jgi:N-acyl-L-homoserine lactone synthetase
MTFDLHAHLTDHEKEQLRQHIPTAYERSISREKYGRELLEIARCQTQSAMDEARETTQAADATEEFLWGLVEEARATDTQAIQTLKDIRDLVRAELPLNFILPSEGLRLGEASIVGLLRYILDIE